MTVNNPRHYCNDACRRAQVSLRPRLPQPVGGSVSPLVLVARAVLIGICIGSWSAILFVGVPVLWGSL